MHALAIIVRAAVTVSTLLTLLGPTVADVVHDDLPPPPEAEPSEPDERDTRPRPNRRERRDANHLDARDADPIGADGTRSTQIWFSSRGASDDGRAGLLGRDTVAAWQDWPPTWPDAFTTGASCEVSCIVTGRAHDNGPGSTVYINVTTTTPVHWFLEVTNEELGYHGTRANYDSMVTKPHASYTDLEPGTTYHATIEVEDAWGNVEEASGTFTTSG